jgi:hypothetical protein
MTYAELGSRSLGEGIADGLDTTHAKGIVHRESKADSSRSLFEGLRWTQAPALIETNGTVRLRRGTLCHRRGVTK